jgi:adenine/guanine phosphoribosyltransferase-like PRPP-binding protein
MDGEATMSATTSGTSPTRHRQKTVWKLTEPLFQRGAHLLAHAARERHGPITAVVGIANGGRVLAYAAGASLNVRAFIVNAGYSTESAIYRQVGSPAGSAVRVDVGELARQVPEGSLRGRVLVVDDICGSAGTLDAVRAALVPYLAADAGLVTAVLCRTPGTRTDPDLWLWQVHDAVIFPWEQASEPATALLPDVQGVRHR